MSTVQTMNEPGNAAGTGAANSSDYPRGPFDCIFTPRSVAVIGATETAGSVGRTVLSNLLRSPFGGPVYPVNPKRHSVLGVPCCADVTAIPEKVDLAVVVPSVIGRCSEAGVKAAVVISAGFREMGTAGAELEQQVLEQARRGGMRL